MEDTANFLEIFKFYSKIIEAPPEKYESEKKKLVLPIVPLPILKSLCERAARIFSEERTVLQINQDIVVVGDLHGHILDLFRILNVLGHPPMQKYLFLGDLVDRGEFSTETVILILTMKVLWPSSVYLIRGNHEFAEMWEHCGFQRELKLIYPNSNPSDLFQTAFACIPIGAIVNKRTLCIHGGVGPSLKEVSMLQNLYRPIYTFDQGVVTDVLWSDPTDDTEDFVPSHRGTGFCFGKNVLTKFLDDNGLDLLVRGHECTADGVHFALDNKVVTVFSASSYCNTMTNKAGIMILKKNGEEPEVHVFRALKYIRRDSALFVSSSDENRFIVDAKKASAASAVRGSHTFKKLPVLTMNKSMPLASQSFSCRSHELLAQKPLGGMKGGVEGRRLSNEEKLPKLDGMPQPGTARKSVCFEPQPPARGEMTARPLIRMQQSVPTLDAARKLVKLPEAPRGRML